MLLKAEHLVSIVLRNLLALRGPSLKEGPSTKIIIHSTSFEVLMQYALFARQSLHLHAQHCSLSLRSWCSAPPSHSMGALLPVPVQETSMTCLRKCTFCSFCSWMHPLIASSSNTLPVHIKFYACPALAMLESKLYNFRFKASCVAIKLLVHHSDIAMLGSN